MKNLLIATTALVATAGFAAADVTLSGAANVGVLNNGDAGAETFMYNNVTATAAMSGETDGGLTFGASISFRAGDNVDLDVGDLQDNPALVGVAAEGDNAATGQLADQLSDINLGNIYVSGDFGKLTFDQNGIDNLMDDGFAHDVSFAGTFGALAVSATANIDGGAQAADGGDFSVKLAYSADGLSASVVTDDSSDYDATVGYALNDMITASVNYDTDGQAAGSETTVKVAYSSNGVSASLAMMDEDINEWAVALGYAANGMAINVAVDDGGSEDLTVSYDLGGGMTINAATNETGAFFVGSKMTF
jgi:outer membrane protein OmpU